MVPSSITGIQTRPSKIAEPGGSSSRLFTKSNQECLNGALSDETKCRVQNGPVNDNAGCRRGLKATAEVNREPKDR